MRPFVALPKRVQFSSAKGGLISHGGEERYNGGSTLKVNKGRYIWTPLRRERESFFRGGGDQICVLYARTTAMCAREMADAREGSFPGTPLERVILFLYIHAGSSLYCALTRAKTFFTYDAGE